jgi:hypothetical protein
MLQVFDQSSNLPPRQAVGLLEKITAQVAASPATYDLMDDPGMAFTTRNMCHNDAVTAQNAQQQL